MTVEGCTIDYVGNILIYIDNEFIGEIIPYDDNCFKKVFEVELDAGDHTLKITVGSRVYEKEFMVPVHEQDEQIKDAQTIQTPTGSILSRYVTAQNAYLMILLLVIVGMWIKRKDIRAYFGAPEAPSDTAPESK